MKVKLGQAFYDLLDGLPVMGAWLFVIAIFNAPGWIGYVFTGELAWLGYGYAIGCGLVAIAYVVWWGFFQPLSHPWVD